MVRRFVRVVWVLGSLVALPLDAQDQGREAPAAPLIPASALPPAGLCRVWLMNVPAGQQPAATKCTTAIRNRPSTAQVLFGEARGDAPPQRTQSPIMSGSATRATDTLSRAVNLLPRTALPAPTPARRKPLEKPLEKPPENEQS